jgi:diaminopimelate decarboxylase
MGDNPRYALYKADYTAVVANKANEPAEMKVTIAGKCCESGDLIQEDTYIQQTEVGDILAILSTGAYNYSMASNYNRIPRPAVVMIRNGIPRIVVKRETYENITRNDI